MPGHRKHWVKVSDTTATTTSSSSNIEVVFGHQIPDDPEEPTTFGSKTVPLWHQIFYTFL